MSPSSVSAAAGPSVTTPTRRRLGEILVSLGILSVADVERALVAQRESGRRLGEVLLEEQLVTPGELLRALAAQYGMEFVDLDEVRVDAELVRRVRAHIARGHRAVPYAREGERIVVAMANPIDVVAADELRNLLGVPIKPVMADPEQVLAKVEQVRKTQT
ncbi:MAG: hypothetical protein ACE5GB_11780, partial [Acidimicrobiales bacterium]